MPPAEGRSESVRERIERLVAEGRKSSLDVARAIALWHESLQNGIALPNGQMVEITLDDLYHLMVDDRILRKPERIELLLRNVFELREAREGRFGRLPHGGRRVGRALDMPSLTRISERDLFM